MKRQRCNSEGESADEEAGAGAPFRVSVCMEQYFSDERARAYVCVRAGRRVRWLARRLRATFGLPPRVALLCGAHLLPPTEPLAVLRPDDVVRVIPSRGDFGGHWAEGDEVDALCVSACNAVTSVPKPEPRRSGHSTAVQDVTDCTPSADGECGAADARGQTPHDGQLAARKRRALLLLEQYAAPAPAPAPGPARPRRRRVRRRRRAPSPAAPPSPAPHSCSPPLPAADASEAAPPAPASPARDAAAPMILRNGDQTPRAPRHIQPLADAIST